MSNVIAALTEERTRVAQRLAALDAAIKALGGGSAAPVKSTGRKAGWKMSAATKKLLSQKAKARWAKIKK